MDENFLSIKRYDYMYADAIDIGLLLLVHPRVETFQSQPQMTRQHHLTLAFPTERALLAEHLAVIGIYGVPAKLLFQKFGSTLLYERSFATVFCIVFIF